MAYTKQTWQDKPSTSTPVNATRLGYMEDGIADAATTADSALTAADAAQGTASAAADAAADALTAISSLGMVVPVPWDGTSWGTYSTDPDKVRHFYSQTDGDAPAPTYYSVFDVWFRQGG